MHRVRLTRLIGAAGVIAGVAVTVALGIQPSAAAAKALNRYPGLRTHMVLGSRTLPAGSSVSGTLIVENTTKAPISVDQGCAGQPEFGVVLTSPAVPQSPAFAMVGCSPVLLSPGIHRYPFVLSATYQGCIEAGGSGSTEPPCAQPRNRLPSLPPGRYRAAMSTMSPIPVAKSIAVKVINQRP